MRISDVTTADIKTYARIDGTADDNLIEQIIRPAAIDHIVNYTGQREVDLDRYEDITIAFLALCSFLYDNRSMTIQNDKINRVVESLLGKYSINLL